MTTVQEAPTEYSRWDMTPYFPQFGGAEYQRFLQSLQDDTKSMLERSKAAGPLTAGSRETWVALICDLETLGSRYGHLGSYLGCLAAADSKDEAVQQDYARLSVWDAEFEKIYVQLLAMLKVASDDEYAALAGHERLKPVRYALDRLRERSRRTMDAQLENLASDLSVDGFSAWGRLYDKLAGTLEFELAAPGQPPRRVPMALKNSLLEDPDAAVRKAALEGSNQAWASVEDVNAAALNSIAGTRLVLDRWRGVPHFLDEALFDAAISRKTLDAMMDAIASRRAWPQQYLRWKAQLMGRTRLGFQDLTAPLPLPEPDRVDWKQATERVLSAFGRLYPEMAEFARMAIEKRWVDSEPRAGKRPGGFCSTSPFISQSRIFLTFNHTLGDVSTLAHELGHAFHSHILKQERPWARRYPMTLAETASIFAETLLADALLSSPEAGPKEQAVLLDARLEQASAFLLNIPMRYLFEKRYYEERAQGELATSRFKTLLLEAQRECYGDVLEEAEMDPYFWASKLHFYIPEVRFYNFPYSFGYLFSLGVFARYKQEGPTFFRRYEELLRATGRARAEDVARDVLGVDLEGQQFWLDSMQVIEDDLKRFKSVVPQVFPNVTLEG